MDKAKVLKTALSIGGTVLMGVATLIQNKVADDKLKETVAEKVAEALANQAKES